MPRDDTNGVIKSHKSKDR